MNRWVVRIIGILILLAFVLLMMNLQRKLTLLQRSRESAPTATTT